MSLPWWKFLIGDLMATSAMLAFFLERHPTLLHHLEGPWTGVAREGALAGVIGGLVVAVWFLICDVAAGEIFRTPAVLGAAIFQGIFDPSQVQVTLPLVLGYTALHFFAFVIFGIATAVMLLAADYEPVFALAAIFLLAIFEIFFVGALAAFDQAALTALGFWKILAGNVLAMIAMLGYFETRHRGWLSRFRERWEVLQLRRTLKSGLGGHTSSAPAQPANFSPTCSRPTARARRASSRARPAASPAMPPRGAPRAPANSGSATDG